MVAGFWSLELGLYKQTRSTSGFRTKLVYQDSMSNWSIMFVRIMVAVLFSLQNVLETDQSNLFVTSAALTPATICTSIHGVTSKQMRFCEKYRSLMASIFEGIATGIKECKFQFRKRRWNCTSLISKPPLYRNHAVPGTKEDAFTHAIIAAGIAHSVARALSSGNFTLPGEKSDTKNSINNGIELAKEFLKGQDSKNQERKLMNRHNNEVGLAVMKNNLDEKCKCEGVSGQCTTRICWKWLPKFRHIGDRLKEIYDNDKTTVKVKPVLRRSVAEKIPSYLVLSRNNNLKPPKDHLVMIRNSPSYCDEINTLKIHVPGTVGRWCKNDHKINSCKVLCCGRGYNVHELLRVWDCQCKFYWCCKVRCKKCSERVTMRSCQ